MNGFSDARRGLCCAMQIVRLENERMRVAIRPDLGAGIGSCEMHIDGSWQPVMRGNPEATWFNDLACYVLAPWSNRIRNARFEWQYLENWVQLKSDWPDGTAIHGDVKAAAFGLLDRSPQSVRMRVVRDTKTDQNWPWKYECIVRYQLDGVLLSTSVIVRNLDQSAMPCGLGLHPFFVTRVCGADARINAPTIGRYPCIGMMPTGHEKDDELCKALRQGWKVDGGLDDVFRLSEAAGEMQIEWPRQLRMTMDYDMPCDHAVIYTGEQGELPSFFCLEPVTHVNDGMNLMMRWNNAGILVLKPGEMMKLETRFTFERLGG